MRQKTPEELQFLREQAEKARKLRDASAYGSSSWSYYEGQMQRYLSAWNASDKEREFVSHFPYPDIPASPASPATYLYSHPDQQSPWHFTSDQLAELHQRDMPSRFQQELQQRDRWNEYEEKADAFEALHEAGLGNPHYRPVQGASGRIYERTDVRAQREYTSRDIQVTPYPSLPAMNPTYTPTQAAAIENARHELLAAMEVSSGGTFSLQAALRLPSVRAALQNQDLPYQVFVVAQKILDNATAQRLSPADTRKELGNAFATDGTQNAIQPYQNLPIRSEILAQADAARGESERLIAEVAAKSGRSPQQLRELTVGRDGYFSHEQIAAIKAVGSQRSPVIQLDGSQGTGKTGTEVMAVLYGISAGKFRFQDIQFASPTHAATNVLEAKFREVAQKGFLPGVDWEKARQYQFRTSYATMMSQLYTHPQIDDGSGNPRRGPSAMEQLEQFTGRPLTKYTMVGFSATNSPSNTFDQHIAKVQQERPSLLRDRVGGPLPPNMNFQVLSQELGRIRTSRYDPATRYADRIAKGKKDAESGQMGTIDSWLYRYSKFLDENQYYDPDDIAPLWIKAAAKGLIQAHRNGYFVGDEIQDFPHDILYAAAVQAKMGTRMLLGGDMGQQITGMSQVRLGQAMPQYFPQAQRYPLSINYRSNQNIVSYGQAMNRHMLAAGMETGPLQIAYSRDVGEPVKTIIRPTWAEVEQDKIQSWMSHIGMTPSTIQYNMQTGRAPLEGAWPEPAHIPMIVQMEAERDLIKKALIKELTPEMGASLAEQAVTRMEQSGQLNMPTVVGAKGSTYFGALTSTPRVGQWSDQGYLMNRNVMAGRPQHFLEEYHTPEHFPYTKSYYDNTPVPAVSGGDLYDPLRAAGMGYEAEALYYGHQAKWDYLETDHRRLLEEQQQVLKRNALKLNQSEMQALGPLLDVLAMLNPQSPMRSVHEGTGLLSLGSGMESEELRELLDMGDTPGRTTMTQAMHDIAEATGQSFKTGHLDAGTLSGKYAMAGSSMTDEYLLRVIEEAGRTGNLDILNPIRIGKPGAGGTSFVPQSAQQAQQMLRGVFGKPTLAHEKEAMKFGREGEAAYDYPAIAPFAFESPNRFKGGQDDDHMHFPGLAEGQVRRAIYDVLRHPYARYHRLTKKLLWDQFSNPEVLAAFEKLAPDLYRRLTGEGNLVPEMGPHQPRGPFDMDWSMPGQVLGRPLYGPHTLSSFVSPSREGFVGSKTLGSLHPFSYTRIRYPRASTALLATKQSDLEQVQRMEVERQRVNRAQHLIGDILYGDDTPSSLRYSLQQAMAHAIAAGDLDSETLSMLKRSLAPSRNKWVEESNARLRRGPGGMALLGLIGTATGGLPPAGISLRTLELLPEVTQEQKREKALLREIYRRQSGTTPEGDPQYYVLPHEAVEGALNRYPYTAGAVVRNIGSPAEGLAKGYDVIQSRHAPFKTEMDAFYTMLQAGMQGDQGGLRLDEDSPMLGLEQLEKELTQMVGHDAFASFSPNRQNQIHDQVQQVRDIQRTLRTDANRDQYAQTLQNIFRMATGMGAFGEGNEPNKAFSSFFRPLRDAEQPRTLKSVQQYLDALQKATQEFQGTGKLSRGTFNEVLLAMGHDPRNKKLPLNANTDLAKRFGSPTAPPMALTDFARGNWFADRSKEERMSILSEMTRIPLNQGQMYHFMGGRPGFAGLTYGQMQKGGLAGGTPGTLHPLPGRNFRMVYDVQFWRDKKNGLFAPGEDYTNLPGDMLYGPVVRFNPGGNSDEKDWHLVRADQLAMPHSIAHKAGTEGAMSSAPASFGVGAGIGFGPLPEEQHREQQKILIDERIAEALSHVFGEGGGGEWPSHLPRQVYGASDDAAMRWPPHLSASQRGKHAAAIRWGKLPRITQQLPIVPPEEPTLARPEEVAQMHRQAVLGSDAYAPTPGISLAQQRALYQRRIEAYVDAAAAADKAAGIVRVNDTERMPESLDEIGHQVRAEYARRRGGGGIKQAITRPTLEQIIAAEPGSRQQYMNPAVLSSLMEEAWLGEPDRGGVRQRMPPDLEVAEAILDQFPPVRWPQRGQMVYGGQGKGPWLPRGHVQSVTRYNPQTGRYEFPYMKHDEPDDTDWASLDQETADLYAQGMFPKPEAAVPRAYPSVYHAMDAAARTAGYSDYEGRARAMGWPLGGNGWTNSTEMYYGAMGQSRPARRFDKQTQAQARTQAPPPLRTPPPSARRPVSSSPPPPPPPPQPPPQPPQGQQQGPLPPVASPPGETSFLIDRNLQERILKHMHVLRKAGFTPASPDDLAQKFELGPDEAKAWHAWAYEQGPVPKMASGLHVPGGTLDPNYQQWTRQGHSSYSFQGQNPLHIPPEQLQADLNPDSPIYPIAQEAKRIIADKRAQQGYIPNPLTDLSVPFQAPARSSTSASSSSSPSSSAQAVNAQHVNISMTGPQPTVQISGAGAGTTPPPAAAATGSAGGGGGGGAPSFTINWPGRSVGGSGGQAGSSDIPGAAFVASGAPPPPSPPPPTNPFGYGNTELYYGHTVARLSSELQNMAQQTGQVADQAAQQGGDYRRMAMMTPYDANNPYGRTQPAPGAPGTHQRMIPGGRIITVSDATGIEYHPISTAPGTSGFFDFTSASPEGIAALQKGYLPMYSLNQINSGLQTYTSLNQGTRIGAGTVNATTDIMGLAAMAGVDPMQLIGQFSGITGAQNVAMPHYPGGAPVMDANSLTRQMSGMVFKSLGKNLSGTDGASNLQSYMQALSQATPILAGMGPQATTMAPTLQAGTLFQMALNSGMSAQNLPQVAQTIGSLAQIGSHPGLQAQYALAQTYGEHALTASPQYFQYKQSMQQQGMQLQGLQLEQKLNVPQLHINADNAQIQMDRVSIQAQQFSLAQNTAQFQQQQYMQTQELGPIGETPAQTGRQAYFQYMARQTAAGYNPLSQDNASTFQFKGKPFGLQNLEFYTGIEHQRNMLTLGRSPLLADASFQEQMKYLNKQETFYTQELQLQNQQRQFTVTWTQKSLEMQAKQLAAAANAEKAQEALLKVDIENQKIYQKNLPAMVANLQQIITNTQQQMSGQGPIHGGNVSPLSLIQSLASDKSLKSDSALYNRVNSMGLNPTEAGIVMALVKQAQTGTSPSQISRELASYGDAGLLKQLQQQVGAGAYLGQQNTATQQDTGLFQGGTNQNWQNLITAVNNTTEADKQLASQMSPSTGLMKYISDLSGHLQAVTGAIGTLSNSMGIFGGIFKLLMPGSPTGGAGGAEGGGGGGMGMGMGGMVGPPPGSHGEFSSDQNIRAGLAQAQGPVGALTHLLEAIQAAQMKKSGATTYSHYGISSPNVNADFHQKLWYGLHQGVDLAASQGSPLSEFVGGEVKATGFFPWGGEVDVAIPGGTIERYLHLSQIAVRPGQIVRRGDRIGLTGGGTPASGFGQWSHGSHLHTQYDYGNINHGIDPWVIWAMAGEKNLGEFIGSGSSGAFGNMSNADRIATRLAAKNMGGGGLYHLYEGGIAMRPVTSRLADGGEPEAVIPLSKLRSVLTGSVGGASSGSNGHISTSGGQASGGRQFIIDKLIGNLNLTQHLASSRMSESEKDQLMADTLDALQTAFAAFLAHNG